MQFRVTLQQGWRRGDKNAIDDDRHRGNTNRATNHVVSPCKRKIESPDLGLNHLGMKRCPFAGRRQLQLAVRHTLI
jgi:hypothetical protein